MSIVIGISITMAASIDQTGCRRGECVNWGASNEEHMETDKCRCDVFVWYSELKRSLQLNTLQLGSAALCYRPGDG